MSAFTIIKPIVETAVSVGAGTIVGNAIRQVAPSNGRLLNKITTGIGGAALAGLIADQASKYAAQTVDELANSVEEIKKNLKGTTDVIKSDLNDVKEDVKDVADDIKNS